MAQRTPLETLSVVVPIAAGLMGMWWIVQQHKHKKANTNPSREGESCKDSHACESGLGCVDGACVPRN